MFSVKMMSFTKRRRFDHELEGEENGVIMGDLVNGDTAGGERIEGSVLISAPKGKKND